MASILICSTPVHGHVTPLLAVARHLAQNGHRVRFLSGSRYQERIEQTGAEFLPLPAEADYDDSDLNASFPGREGLSGPAGIRYDISQIFLAPALSQLAAVESALAAVPTDAVLVEHMFTGTMGLMGTARSKRPAVVSLGIVPLSVGDPNLAPYGLGITPMGGPIGRLRNRALKFLAQKVIFGSVQKEAEAMVLQATGHPLTGFFMSGNAKLDAIVQFSVPSFEYPRVNMPENVHFVGPLSRTQASAGELPDWWHELDGSTPVVHVSQGTIANRDYEQLIAPAIRGLANEDVLVVVSTGGRPVETLTDALTAPLPANVRIAEYIPHDKLLPLTDVYVTNGGYGGVHYAFEHGVPLVVAGKTEDKAEVSARVAWAGAGVNLATNEPAADKIRLAVQKVLAEGSYRAASARIGAEIRASSGLAGLERVIEQVTQLSANTGN